jgi:hypothetical protein
MNQRLNEVVVERVVHCPERVDMKPGVVYYSEEHRCAIHLCCCGWCGEETVLSIHPERGWNITIDEQGKVTFTPSIGNYSMPCRSHYNITGGKVVWHAS